MKAIQTQYRGYFFRSRLEARWAVFFDKLGIEWQYEPEGFELGSAGRYLPDFYLSSMGVWVEVKAQKLNEYEREKAFALSSYTNKILIELCQIPDPNEIISIRGVPAVRMYYGVEMDGLEKDFHMGSLLDFFMSKTGNDFCLSESEMCAWALEWDMDYYREKYGKEHPHHFKNGFIAEGEVFCGFSSSDLYNAAIAARSARFEFGQTPA